MRPLGVTLTAIYEFLRAGVYLLLGLGVVSVGGLLSKLMPDSPQGATMSRLTSGAGHLIGILFLLYAALPIALGIGLLLLKNWARILTIVLSALAFLVSLRSLLGVHHRPMISLAGLLHLAIVIYLLLPGTTRAFTARSTSQAA